MKMKKNKISLKDMFNSLEQIVTKLESSEIDIDEMVDLYEKGMKIAEKCKKQIKEAELKVKLINQNQDKKNKV